MCIRDSQDGVPKPGLVVERHLIDGDVAIFNRQPSLHRMSMMVHEVRVMEGNTFRFNLAVCTPYNADFDGDEMNLHVIQGEEARAEATILMRVQEHILTPRYGGAVIGGIHDHISGAYLMTREDTIVEESAAMEMLGQIKYTGPLPKSVKTDDGEIGYRGHDLLHLIVPDNIQLRFKNRSGEEVIVVPGVVSGEQKVLSLLKECMLTSEDVAAWSKQRPLSSPPLLFLCVVAIFLYI